METSPESAPFDDKTLVYLRALSAQFPSIDAVLAAIAKRRAVLTLPKTTTHVISDIHGDFKKLVHVINNASGSLRPLVESTFRNRLSRDEQLHLLNLIYYPLETYAHFTNQLPNDAEKRRFFRSTIRNQFEIIRHLALQFDLARLDAVWPARFSTLLRELLHAPYFERSDAFVNGILDTLIAHGRDMEFVRVVARVIRNLLIGELVVAGDFGDRGPRIDKVIDYVKKQPNVSITWGNHDASWMGACLGQMACIAEVLRMSLRYQRLFQLEMGYGIPIASVEKLAREVYGDDPAARFKVRGRGIRDPLPMARMQKAMTIILFKLEGQTIRRNPQFNLEHRNLLHRIDPKNGTVEIDGKIHPLLDTHLPTIDWSDPYTLSPEEDECMRQMQVSFVQSQTLWDHMRYVAQKGAMFLCRDRNLIFHGCVPVDDTGEFLEIPVNGRPVKGRELFEALTQSVHAAFRTHETPDLDMLWYLWCGPLSPLFGKDKIATFETHFVMDPEAHKETKNAYFRLIHERPFCRKVLEEFGVEPETGLIVNGHVPVKIEQGESPVKKSGQAVTIDGAFSEAYGDKGYTLVLDAHRTYLALHHHFESVSDAITEGADIIPTIEEICVFDPPRRFGDTRRGNEMVHEIEALELLLRAYEENVLPERE